MTDSSAAVKLFKLTQKTYKDIGIHPPESNENRSQINPRNWLFIFSQAQFLYSSAAYLVFEAYSIIEFEMASITCSAVVAALIVYLIIYSEMKNVSSFIGNCERFIEKRVYSTNVYKDANDKIEQITKLFAFALSVYTAIVVLLPLCYTIVGYFILDSGPESFFLFFPAWWPFDWKTPFGYLMAWCAQFTGFAAMTKISGAALNIIFGSCWLFIVVAEDITHDVAAFNNKTVESPTNHNRTGLMNRFCNIIRHYSAATQLIKDFNEMNQNLMFVYILWHMFATSSLLMTLQFQLWDKNSNRLEVMILLAVVLCVFLLNLITCESGEKVVNQFDQFGVVLGQCEWNNLTIEMQRMYLIFLLDTQQAKIIQFGGGIACTCNTFKKISTNGFAYFMTLRQFWT